MADEKCHVYPDMKCDVREKVTQIEYELGDFRRNNTKTHENFGARIGDLEAHNKVQDVEVKNLQKSIDSMGEDVKEVKGEMKEMSKQVPVIAEQVKSIHEKSTATDADVDEIKSKPGKRWDSVVGQIIGLVIAAVVGMILARIGLGG